MLDFKLDGYVVKPRSDSGNDEDSLEFYSSVPSYHEDADCLKDYFVSHDDDLMFSLRHPVGRIIDGENVYRCRISVSLERID